MNPHALLFVNMRAKFFVTVDNLAFHCLLYKLVNHNDFVLINAAIMVLGFPSDDINHWAPAPSYHKNNQNWVRPKLLYG